MWNPRALLLLLLGVLLSAQEPAPPAWKPGALHPGEGLAVTLEGGPVQCFGEASKEAPMGSLAKLVWLKLEGVEWVSRDVRFRCTGTLGPYHCWKRDGHGREDLGKALRESCNLAFLFWAGESMGRWRRDYGEAAARLRMEEAFAPFLGDRLPPGDTLPALTPAWVGDGDLLRTSPKAMAEWLADPGQGEVREYAHRYLSGFFTEIGDLIGREAWWFKTGTAPVPGEPGATSAWVAGGRGGTLAVLHIPRGRGKGEAMARFREIMGLR